MNETLHSIGIVHNDIKINQFIFKNQTPMPYLPMMKIMGT